MLLFGLGNEIVCQTSVNPNSADVNLKKVIDELNNKPKWLVLEESCPLSLIPNQQKKISYLSDECEKNPSRCLEDCKKEDGNACYSLALLVQIKTSIDNKSAESLFLLSCKYGVASGCTNYAAGRFDSENVETLKCSVDTFEKTCEMDDSWGCTMFGLALIKGVSRKPNQAEAIKYLKKVCDLNNNSEACKGATRILETIEPQKK